MTTTTPRALLCEDGTKWPDRKRPFSRRAKPDPTVTKLVIGTPPTSGNDEPKKVTLAEPLPDNFAAQFPNLTHLHLWQIANLTTLPELPPKLQCLDLRGCDALATLPALPPSLETLDLGQCAGLKRLPDHAPQTLTRFYFNGCAGLKPHYLKVFLERLGQAPLVEMDGSDAPGMTSLEGIPRQALRKLVLKGCGNLTDVSGLGEFPNLEHLNLCACTALRDLPDLPPKLRYLRLHASEQLGQFMGQDIGPIDRGAEDENVAHRFLSRRKFGADLAIMPHAKLLLLGDGRVGKSTLAKRLQWEELTPAARKDPANGHLKPSENEEFTHKVRFWRWETGLTLPDNDLEDLEARAAAAKVKLPKTKRGLLDGAVRLWDFGGQEIYHHTHRIFAGEGSIFLIVWRAEPPEIGNGPDEVTPEEWKEWNRHRSLDYWLDYIDSMRPDARVALVCTNCTDPDNMASKPDWKTRAPKHRDRKLEAFFVDSLDPDCGRHSEYQRLVTWIREECGREARRIGILQPRFYRQISDRLDGWLESNSQARQDERTAEHLLCAWTTWHQSVRAAYTPDPKRPQVTLDDNDITTITDYLHEAGHLFQIRHEQLRAILVDQEWAAGLIYQLLQCKVSLRATVKRNGGWFYQSDLENDPLWKTLEDAVQRERLLAYMEECGVVTRIAEARVQRFAQDVYLASDTWLLPPYEKVQDQVERQMDRLRGRPEITVRDKFEFDALTVSEFDFRSLQARLARTFGARAIYFRNGFQAIDSDATPDWCFRVRWMPKTDDPFVGKIGAVLHAKSSQLVPLAGQIDDLFYAEGSPIAHKRPAVKRQRAEEGDLRHEYFLGPRQEKYDVAVSSSGADRVEVELLVAALEADGLKVNHYLLPECRTEDRIGVLNFMMSLSRQPCIVLVLSDGYLHNDPETNWYCAWELADAIRQLYDGRRSAKQTLAVFKPGDGVTSSNVNKVIVPLLTSMAQHFGDAYTKVPVFDRPNFDYYNDFMNHFLAAVTDDKCKNLFKERGTLGSYLTLPADPTAPGAFDAIVRAVRQAVGKTPP
jgi:GTPase SAR1 family protein